MRQLGIAALRLLGAALIGGGLVLLYMTTVLAGLSAQYDVYTLLGMFVFGLALWGPFTVVGVYFLFFPWTWTRHRVRRMRFVIWGMAALPVGVAAYLLVAGDRTYGKTGVLMLYLFLFLLSAGIGTVLVQPRRA